MVDYGTPANLTDDAIAAMTTYQIASLSTQFISFLTASQIAALTTAEVHALTTLQVAALSASQRQAFTASQISAMTTEDFAIWSRICFPAGTPVLTNLGYTPIEQIDPVIHTVRNKSIVAITKTVSDEKYLIRIAKHALGNNYPSKTTLISQNHQVMFMGHMIKAKDLVGLVNKVTQVPYNGEPLYNVLLETHDKMQVNNLIVETLHPEHKIAQLYKLLNMVKPEEREQMIALYNQFEYQHKQSITK